MFAFYNIPFLCIGIILIYQIYCYLRIDSAENSSVLINCCMRIVLGNGQELCPKNSLMHLMPTSAAS